MYKYLRAITPVILVLFMSVYVIAPAFGAEKDKEKNNNKEEKIGDVQIDMFLYSYDPDTKQEGEAIQKPATGDVFKMDLKVKGKGSQVTDVRMLNNAFAQIDSYKGQDESPWIHRKAFILRSPDKAGIYPCTFECTDKDGNSALVNMALEIVQKAPVIPPVVSPVVTPIATPEQPVQPPQIIQPDQPLQPGKTVQPGTTYKIMPVYTSYGTMHRTQTMHMTGWTGGWSVFWFGFIVGVIVSAVIYSAGAASAAK